MEIPLLQANYGDKTEGCHTAQLHLPLMGCVVRLPCRVVHLCCHVVFTGPERHAVPLQGQGEAQELRLQSLWHAECKWLCSVREVSETCVSFWI